MADNMTATEKNRIDHLERGFVGLSGEVKSLDARMTGLEERQDEANRGIQTLLNRQGGYEATKGMVPVDNIKWAMVFFVALAGLGLKLLQDHKVSQDQKLETVVKLEDARHQLVMAQRAHLVDEVKELDTWTEELRERIRNLENSSFTPEKAKNYKN